MSSTIGRGGLTYPDMHACLSVLVTGSSGFIGAHAVRHLHTAGHRVTGLDHIPPKVSLPVGVAFHVCDIRRWELPDRTFDAVVHLAALAGVRPSMDRPLEYEITNVIGTIYLPRTDGRGTTQVDHVVVSKFGIFVNPPVQRLCNGASDHDAALPLATNRRGRTRRGR